MLVRPRYKEAFFSLENQGKEARFARVPHDHRAQTTSMSGAWSTTSNSGLLLLRRGAGGGGWLVKDDT